jgi:hypothetical protein
MAYDVTSQWDDIHRKLGNYEELPKEKKQAEYSKEAIEYMEGYDPLAKKTADELEELEDDLDDEFMRAYKAQRLQELQRDKTKPTYEGVREITRQDYIDEVTNAKKGTYVFLHLYATSSDTCAQMDKSMLEMTRLYPHIKFLKILGNRCIENYPEVNCPTVVVYLNGSMVVTLPRVDKKYRKLTVAALEDILQSLGVLPKQDRRNEETAENLKGNSA